MRKRVRKGSRLGLPYDNPLDNVTDDWGANSRSKSKKSSIDVGGSRENPAFTPSDTDNDSVFRPTLVSSEAVVLALSSDQSVNNMINSESFRQLEGESGAELDATAAEVAHIETHAHANDGFESEKEEPINTYM